jgi:hypothetical protein
MALTGDVEMPRDGQRVRVVLEGDAWGVSGETFRVGERGWNMILPTASHVMSVEVLRPPVGVDDVLEAAADLDDLPVRAVVLDRAGDAWQRHAGDWRCTTGGICTTSDITGYGPFTVVSLGRGAA